jgi:hypothetical protein
MPAEIWVSFREVHILRRVEEDHRTSVQRIAAAEGISVPLVWKIFMNNYFTHKTSNKCKPSLLLTTVQGWCFANGFSQNAL